MFDTTATNSRYAIKQNIKHHYQSSYLYQIHKIKTYNKTKDIFAHVCLFYIIEISLDCRI